MRDLKDLAERLRAFAAVRHWETFHSPKNLAMALAGEVGELVAELQWLSEDETQAEHLDEALRHRLADEVADVLIYLVRFADVCAIDLLTEAHAKIARNESRYPVELSRGSAEVLEPAGSRPRARHRGRALMAQVVIQPSYGNAEARAHWARTLKVPVRFTDGPHRTALTAEQLATLTTFHLDGYARFWGATANQDKKMDTLRVGDVVLFTGQKMVRAVGEVAASFRNPEFADTLWSPHPTNGSFRNVYSLLTFQPVQIPYEEIWALPSFNEGDMFMGLRFLDAAKGEEVLDGLEIETVVSGQLASVQEQAVAAALDGAQVIPAEALNTTQTSYEKAAGTVLVHRAEALLVKEYIESLNIIAGKRFKTPTAESPTSTLKDRTVWRSSRPSGAPIGRSSARRSASSSTMPRTVRSPPTG